MSASSCHVKRRWLLHSFHSFYWSFLSRGCKGVDVHVHACACVCMRTHMMCDKMPSWGLSSHQSLLLCFNGCESAFTAHVPCKKRLCWLQLRDVDCLQSANCWWVAHITGNSLLSMLMSQACLHPVAHSHRQRHEQREGTSQEEVLDLRRGWNWGTGNEKG